MKIKYLPFLLAIFWLLSLQLYSQSPTLSTITITDATSKEPIEGVLVRDEANPQQIVVSDKRGRIDISQFQENTHLVFQHVGFEPQIIALAIIKANGGTLSLKENVLSLNEIVLSASKWEQEKKHIPNQIVSIEPQDISFNNPQTTADMLQQTGQVFVQKSQQGGGSPIIRGFAANSVLIMVDGVRMNNAIYRGGNLQNVIALDANALESAEVVFGPGSVLYGSDALGGVMDFHTKKPTFNAKEGLRVEGSIMTRYATANNEMTGHADVNLSSKKWALLSSFTYSDFDDLRSGNNRPNKFPEFGKRLEYINNSNGLDEVVSNPNVNLQKFSGYKQLNLMNKVAYKAAEELTLTYSFHYSTTSDVPRYDRLIERRDNQLRNAEWYYSPQTWQLHALNATFTKKNVLFDRLKNTLAYQSVTEGRNDRRFGNPNLSQRKEEVDVFSWNLEAEKKLHEKVDFYYGLEMLSNHVNSSAFSTNFETGAVEKASTRYPNGGSNLSSSAIYSSAKYFMDDQTTITAGIRFNHTWINATFSDTTFFPFPFSEANLATGSVNGSLGLTHRPSQNTQINFNVSSGFRAPNIDDLGKVFDSEPGIVVVPNPDLRPENTYNIEAGISQIFAQKLKVQGTVFYSFLRDALVRRPFLFNGSDSLMYDGTLSQVQALTNTGKAYIWGFSSTIDYQINDFLTLLGSFNYIAGEDTENNEPLRHVSPMFGQLSLKFKKNRFQSVLFSDFNGRIKFEDLAPSEQNKPQLYTEDGSLAWFTINLQASYRFLNSLYLQASLENITDLHYRPYSSGISAPGRNFRISARYNF